jgi:hypothetical protein
MRESYIIFCIEELHNCIDELYELMMDHDKEESIKKCKHAIRLLRDIITDFDDE